MEIYNGTGKLKTGEQRVNRPIDAILFETDESIANLENETLDAFIEKTNGDDTHVAINGNLRRIILLCEYGQTSVDVSNGISAIIPIGVGGYPSLSEKESMKFALSDIKAAKTYSLNGIESPVQGGLVYGYDEKVVLADEISKKLNVEMFDTVALEGINSVDYINVTYRDTGAGERTVKLMQKELKAIYFDVEEKRRVDNILVFPISDVVSMDIFKTAGTGLNLTMRSAKRI